MKNSSKQLTFSISLSHLIKAIEILILVALIVFSFIFVKKIHKIHRRVTRLLKIQHSTDSSLYTAYLQSPAYIPLEQCYPSILKKYLPFDDASKFVTDVKNIKIRNMPFPYNSSIIEGKNGNYWLFFRYDISNPLPIKYNLPLQTYIGVAELDKNFQQTSMPFITINTGSKYCEDPRAFRINGELFVVYNDITSINPYSRAIFLASLDEDTFQIKYTTNFDQYISPIEKNWIPFSTKKDTLEHPHFVYQMNPHKILEITDPKNNKLKHLTFPKHHLLVKDLWPKELGIPRGGTPAQLVNGEFLTFFHSAFKDSPTDTIWYIMGAYTFESKPPYRITAISKKPIFFDNIYDTIHSNSANKKLRHIFPSGYVIENKGNKQYIHVSAGENDSGTKIITLDKNELLKSMKKISYSKAPLPKEVTESTD